MEDTRYLESLDLIKEKKYEDAADLLSEILQDCGDLLESKDPNCGIVNYYYSLCLYKIVSVYHNLGVDKFNRVNNRPRSSS